MQVGQRIRDLKDAQRETVEFGREGCSRCIKVDKTSRERCDQRVQRGPGKCDPAAKRNFRRGEWVGKTARLNNGKIRCGESQVVSLAGNSNFAECEWEPKHTSTGQKRADLQVQGGVGSLDAYMLEKKMGQSEREVQQQTKR